MKYGNVLFDFDGTLFDTSEGIANGVCYALSHFGIFVEDKEFLKSFMGPPLTQSFEKHYGFNEKQQQEALKLYREFYNGIGERQCCVFDGVIDMLSALKKKGLRLFVATSKPTQCATGIMKRADVYRFFDAVSGAEDGVRELKIDVINYLLESLKLDKSKTIMVGDRCYDVDGAKKAGIDSIGVAYGFGGAEELRTSGADFVVDTPQEITKLLLED